MKITLISGSPRQKGNTATLLNEIENFFTHNNKVERIDITDYDINGCLGCSKCQEITDQTSCIQKDDANELLNKLIESDLIIYGTPLYGHNYSSQLKTFLDRQVALFKFIDGKDKDVAEMEMKSLLEGKPVMLIVTCQGPEKNNTEIIKLLFDKYCETSQTHSLGKFIFPFCTDDISATKERSQQTIKMIIHTIQEFQNSNNSIKFTESRIS